MSNAPNQSDQFYEPYKAANPLFSSDTFSCAEETTAELLKQATTSDHPRMLLGKVQSGKTRTFMSHLRIAAILGRTRKARTPKQNFIADQGFADLKELERAL